MWSKICHVETFLHMINVETIFLSLFMLICREICFVAIYAVLAQNLCILSRFTRFCVKKSLFRFCACGEKRTNIRYDISWSLPAKYASSNNADPRETWRPVHPNLLQTAKAAFFLWLFNLPLLLLDSTLLHHLSLLLPQAHAGLTTWQLTSEAKITLLHLYIAASAR